MKTRRYLPKVDLHSYIVAGAGVGIAAAFNTPLGGLAFVLEEVSISDFGSLRHAVMLAVIVAGLTSQAFIGNELYLGSPTLSSSGPQLIFWAAVIGIAGGICGSVFGRIVASERLHRLPVAWWIRALVCGVLVAVIGLLFSGQTSGSGYHLTREFMEGKINDMQLMLPIGKLVATSISTLSGMGGGILAPSLSIGSSLGVAVGRIGFFSDLRFCALMGMVAYFTGAFQIPLTAVIVVMEMTNQHSVIFPMMVSALGAFMVARVMMPISLYHRLIDRSYRDEPVHGRDGHDSSVKS